MARMGDAICAGDRPAVATGEQRLEEMVVAPVDDGDVDSGAGQAVSGG
jgi:hypothetical protein